MFSKSFRYHSEAIFLYTKIQKGDVHIEMEKMDSWCQPVDLGRIAPAAHRLPATRKKAKIPLWNLLWNRRRFLLPHLPNRPSAIPPPRRPPTQRSRRQLLRSARIRACPPPMRRQYLQQLRRLHLQRRSHQPPLRRHILTTTRKR